jgi:C4-dicarboxylate-specific signal transduction histidine kinase
MDSWPHQKIKGNLLSMGVKEADMDDLEKLREELAAEKLRSAQLAGQVALQSRALNTIDRKMESLTTMLHQVITGYNSVAPFDNPLLETITGPGASRCWLHDPDCPNAPSLDNFTERMKICSNCEAFKLAAPDAFSRARELINSILFLLNRHHDQFKEAQAQLIQSERLAGLGELAAGLAHEINTPVGIILARLDCIQMEQPENMDKTLAEDLEVVRRHATRLRRITSSLTSFARRHKIDKRPVILQDLLREILEITERMVNKGNVIVHANLPNEPMIVYGDGTLIQQVFMNLIINARDAMSDGGSLHIDTLLEHDCHVLQFRDTGVGMDQETRTRVFDPFFSTKADRGTGLGLSVSYGIIKDLGGNIDVQSEPGAGSIFRVAIPRHHPDMAEAIA